MHNYVNDCWYCMYSEEKEVSRGWSTQRRLLGENGLKVDHEGGWVLDEWME